MAINWIEYEPNSPHVIKRTWKTHEGLVVAGNRTTCERVMSDIWADVSYCHVWNPEKGCVETVTLGWHFELCSTFGHSEVDASPEIMAKVAVKAAEALAAIEAQKEADRQAREEEILATPERGKVLRVVKGRKVPRGSASGPGTGSTAPEWASRTPPGTSTGPPRRTSPSSPRPPRGDQSNLARA